MARSARASDPDQDLVMLIKTIYTLWGRRRFLYGVGNASMGWETLPSRVGNASLYLLNTFRRVLALWTFVGIRGALEWA